MRIISLSPVFDRLQRLHIYIMQAIKD